MERKWNKERVVSTIQDLHASREKLNSNHVQQYRVSLYHAACIHWGSWKAAIEAAGLVYASVRVKVPNRKIVWSKDIVIQTIKDLHEQGENLNSNHIQVHRSRLYGAGYKYFGGWSEAIIAAGLDYEKVRVKKAMRTWSKETIVQEIVRRFNSGRLLNTDSVMAEDYKLYVAAKRHFGRNGWAKARVQAGFPPIDPRPWQIWNRQTVREEILRLNESKVSLDITTLVENGHESLIRGGAKVFGSWELAVTAIGLNYDLIRRVHKPRTNEDILSEIAELEERGIRLSSKAIQSAYPGLFSSAVARFGCWSQAVEEAGISYRTHCRIWSTKAWLRQMDQPTYDSITRPPKKK